MKLRSKKVLPEFCKEPERNNTKQKTQNQRKAAENGKNGSKSMTKGVQNNKCKGKFRVLKV